jgi:hypothetical protein
VTAVPPTTDAPVLSALTLELEEAHRRGVQAAVAGLCDTSLGEAQLAGTTAPLLAEAAVSSATPYLRAPLLGRLSAVSLLHGAGMETGTICPSCGQVSPCQTQAAIQ